MNVYYFKLIIFISINQLHRSSGDIFGNDESISCTKDKEECVCETQYNEIRDVKCNNLGLSYIPEFIYEVKDYMYLDNNKITKLTPGMLDSFHQLRLLSVKSNEITIIEDNTFKKMSSLEYLYLDNNKIKKLTRSMFNGFDSTIYFLSIKSNEITTIEKNTFSDLGTVINLYLDNNKIIKLTPGMFDNARINSLMIESSEITVIEDNTFSNIRMLRNLILDNNNITKLTQRMFKGLETKEFSYFSIKSNGITVIENNTFSNMKSLYNLYLDNNKIKKLTPGMLSGLKLFTFSMKSNEITIIEDNTFSNMDSYDVYLDGNKIRKLTPGTFNGIRIKHLSLSSNEIAIIENNTFSKISGSQCNLYLDNNKITKLTPGMLNGTMLNLLSMKSNQITIIEDNTFNNLGMLRNLYLDNNKIGKLTPGMLNGIRVEHLSLLSNEITIIEDNTLGSIESQCDLYLDNNKITKLTPGMLNGTKLNLLSMKSNEITIIEDNTFNNVGMLRDLYLDDNKIKILTPRMLNGLEKLYLELFSIESNEITFIEDNTFTNMKSLRNLYLAHNSIIWTNGDMFNSIEKLTNLTTDEYRLCCLLKKRKLSKCIPEVTKNDCNDLLKDTVSRICVRIVGVVTIFANLFVIVFRTKYNQFYANKVNSFLIRNLAISDLFMGFYLLIIVIADIVFTKNFNEKDFEWRCSVWCHLAGIMSTFSSSLTAFILMIITMERVFAVMYPFRTTFQGVKISMTIAWIVAIIIAIIPLPVFPIEYFKNFYKRSDICLPLHISSNQSNGWHYSVFIFLVLYSIAFTIMLLSNVVIFRATKKTRQAVNVSNDKSLQQMVMIFRMTLFVLADATCKIPVIILGVKSLSKDIITPTRFQWMAIFITPLNAALNPILYTLSSLPSAFRFVKYLQSLKFRWPFIIKVKCRPPAHKKSRNQITEMENRSSDKTTHNTRGKKESS